MNIQLQVWLFWALITLERFLNTLTLKAFPLNMEESASVLEDVKIQILVSFDLLVDLKFPGPWNDGSLEGYPDNYWSKISVYNSNPESIVASSSPPPPPPQSSHPDTTNKRASISRRETFTKSFGKAIRNSFKLKKKTDGLGSKSNLGTLFLLFLTRM